MRIVLLNPNTGLKERIENEAAWPPLGLLYLGTVLQESGHHVKIIDNAKARSSVERVAEQVKKENPEVVGVSVLTPTFRHAIKITKAIKEKNSAIKTVFGNYHATFEYERLLKNYRIVDCVVLGEGERTFLELVDVIEGGGKMKNVKGIAYRQGKRVIKTPPRPLIQELDELNFPDRKLLEFEYHSELVGLIGSAGKFTTLLTSRGCPYACKYCACSAFSSRKIRFRSPENVAAEMELLYSEGYDEVGFVDDNLFQSKKRVEKICDLLISRKIRLDMWAEGRTDLASKEILTKLSRAGCKTVYFGMESGSQKVLDYYGKNITPEINKKAVSNSKEAGIENVIGSFVVGAPIETREDIKKTFDFAMGLYGMDFPQMNILNLSPGMELWDIAIKSGCLVEDEYWDVPVSAVNVFPSHLKETDLIEMIDDFYKKFITRPSYVMSQLLKTLKSEYRLRIVLANIRSGSGLTSVRSLWGK